MSADAMMIRKSAFGRTNLFMNTTGNVFREVKCTSSISRQPTASIFHMHPCSTMETDPSSVCWHCCESFETSGIRLPRLFDTFERIFHVYGWFCSPCCGKAYILEHTTFDRGQQMSVFAQMLRQVYNITENIVEAPPRIALKKFGGLLDIDDFRKQTNICQVRTPPFVSYCMLIEERQPIASIGEGKIPTQQGSVRGLRKPQQGTVRLSEQDQICTPECVGLFKQFVQQQQPVVPSSSSAPVSSQPSKRVRREASAGSGLERFMK